MDEGSVLPLETKARSPVTLQVEQGRPLLDNLHYCCKRKNAKYTMRSVLI